LNLTRADSTFLTKQEIKMNAQQTVAALGGALGAIVMCVGWLMRLVEWALYKPPGFGELKPPPSVDGDEEDPAEQPAAEEESQSDSSNATPNAQSGDPVGSDDAVKSNNGSQPKPSQKIPEKPPKPRRITRKVVLAEFEHPPELS
jgi:hypothetical protein